MLARPQARRDADFQVERDSDQLARCAFLLFKTPSFWTYDNETPRHALDDFLQGSRSRGRGGRRRIMPEELTLRGAKAWMPRLLPPRRGGIVIDLKSCPVCNGSAYTECRLATTFVGIVEMWRVSCDKVGCPAKTPLFDTLKEAVDAWNSQSGQNASRPLASSARLG